MRKEDESGWAKLRLCHVSGEIRALKEKEETTRARLWLPPEDRSATTTPLPQRVEKQRMLEAEADKLEEGLWVAEPRMSKSPLPVSLRNEISVRAVQATSRCERLTLSPRMRLTSMVSRLQHVYLFSCVL